MTNTRGEIWVIGQLILIVAIVVAGILSPGGTSWYTWISGAVVMAVGVLLLLFSGYHLGANLTALPSPKPGGALVETGLYGWVRHPIYTSVITIALGWSLLTFSGWVFVLSLALAVWLDRKAAREEVWLRETYPGYADYAKRVRKLVPGVY